MSTPAPQRVADFRRSTLTIEADAPRVAFHTLGCKVNFHDTEGVASLFRRSGYRVVDFDDLADVYVINTCSVTNTGAKKSRQSIRKAVSQNPRAVVVAMGCYAQYAPDEVGAIPGVDIVIGTHRRAELVEMVQEVMQTGRPSGRWRRSLKCGSLRSFPHSTLKVAPGRRSRSKTAATSFARFAKFPGPVGEIGADSPSTSRSKCATLPVKGSKRWC